MDMLVVVNVQIELACFRWLKSEQYETKTVIKTTYVSFT